MNRRQILRRGATLCCHCIRNIAFYLSGWRDAKPVFKGQFLINANSNFLDIAILEWCKLYGEKRGMHRWDKLITNSDIFLKNLLKHLAMNVEQWEAYIKEMRTYRDTFIAHLDLEERMQIPYLDIALKSTIFLYDHLLTHEDDGDFFDDALDSALAFYNRFYNEGKSVYGT